MVINHVQRIDLSSGDLRIIGGYLGHQRAATRNEIKALLDAHGQFGNDNWIDILEEGRRNMEEAQKRSSS